MIRPAVATDIPSIAGIIAAVALFDPDLLGAMIRPYLDGEGDERWLVSLADDRVVGVAYVAAEPMTSGTWNLRLIAVDPTRQGRGHGSGLIDAAIGLVGERAARLLLVETAGTDDFAATRDFYRGRGFEAEARLRDFYEPGVDKIVFRRALG